MGQSMPAGTDRQGAVQALNVLITNINLGEPSGTVVVVAQLADALRARGHRVALFAPQLGVTADAMRADGHVVVDRLGALPWRPDVIHGQHTAPTMAALAALPGVPALYLCHDATAPFDAAPGHPRLRRRYAVDERCRARLIAEGAEAVGLLPNAVDLGRIPPRSRAYRRRSLDRSWRTYCRRGRSRRSSRRRDRIRRCERQSPSPRVEKASGRAWYACAACRGGCSR